MSNITLEKAKEALATVQDPDLKRDLVSLNMARRIEILPNDVVKFNLVLTTPACPLKTQIEDDCKAALKAAGASDVIIETTAEVRGFRGMGGKQPVQGVKNILAVSSGKGGVGKSTVSVNLAISLAKTGAKVGILDADITGPNIPLMLGSKVQPGLSEDGKRMMPIEAHGLKYISMGLLVKDNEPVIWRGPMLHSAINQFLRDVAWGELDYLVIDLPPGTSDAQLTISQAVPIAGAVIVSTPQEVALLDSKKGLMMFKQMNVPVLGLIENMSYFIAPDTGNSYDIFGSGGAKRVAAELDVECLGQIPIEIDLRIGGDTGVPLSISNPDSESAKCFADIAKKIAAKLSIQSALEASAIEV
ncbi:MAG: iron-sulfur cluster carrier protein ApbC [Candidatus Caenarcaniphilales bacterium]|nr:iron-sulfur cluster carrier protein ApbC [Candidatus Caenarcaniphilales bacterium]